MFGGGRVWRDAVGVFKRQMFLWALRHERGSLLATERFLGVSKGWGGCLVRQYGLQADVAAIRKEFEPVKKVGA